jgi:antibiotic biosynthesis monooxygenase (ABM) superfamily enzyme
MTVADIIVSTWRWIMVQPVTSQEAPDVRRQGAQKPGAAPPRYKLALLSWAGAYAVITLILAVLGPVMAPWPLPLRTLLLSVLMVVVMTWLVMPTLTRFARGWLTSGSAGSAGPAPGEGR